MLIIFIFYFIYPLAQDMLDTINDILEISSQEILCNIRENWQLPLAISITKYILVCIM